MKLLSLRNIDRTLRDESAIVCCLEKGGTLLWGELWDRVESLRKTISACDFSPTAVLFSPERVEFLVTFLALLAEGRDILLPGALPPETITRFEKEGHSLYIEGDVTTSFAEDGSIQNDSLKKEHESKIYLYTSGSTGEPQMIEKGIDQLNAEVKNLSILWGASLEGNLICGSVSQQHIYGLLFVILVPFCSNVTFYAPMIEYPELLSGIDTEKLTFISSPAFLKRLIASPNKIEGQWGLSSIFSSGGALAENISQKTEEIYNTPVLEVYGSTETGGVAWRRFSTTKRWTPFDGIETSVSEQGTLSLRSPYLVDDKLFETADLVKFEKSGSFELLGRVDSIVKMEEKRISLKEVANRIEEHSYIKEGHAILISGGRQSIGIVAVLSDAGDAQVKNVGRKFFIKEMKEYMGRFFDTIFIPRKWRFVEEVPCDAQGKVFKENLQALFKPTVPDWNYQVVRLDLREKKLRCRIIVSPESIYFRGHFDGFPILPGVAQVDFATKLAEHHLGFDPKVRVSPRIKFNAPIKPGDIVYCDIIGRDEMNAISFRYSSLLEGKTVSQGKLVKTT